MAQSVRIISLWFLLTVSATAQFGLPFGMVHAVEAVPDSGYVKWASDSLSIWIESDNLGSSAKADADTVGLWRNMGDCTAKFTATSTAPAYYSNQTNGKPAIRFDGTKTLVSGLTLLRTVSNDSSIAVYLVYKPAATSPTQYVLNTANSDMQWQLNAGFRHSAVGAYGITARKPSGWQLQRNIVYGIQVALANKAVVTVNDSVQNISSYPSNGYLIMGRNSVITIAASSASLDLAAIMCFKKPLSTERDATVVSYLKTKYGTP
jgi:hypothetical protein